MAKVTAGPDAVPEAELRKVGAEAKTRTEKIRIEQHSAAGLLWFIGWLFTIGYLHLPFWKAVLGIVVWPYYLGVSLARLAG
jgi:hypothetical protein